MSAVPEGHVEVLVKDDGQVDAILAAVTDAIERRRAAILSDPTIANVTLIVRLDRGPAPDVLYRTESRETPPGQGRRRN